MSEPMWSVCWVVNGSREVHRGAPQPSATLAMLSAEYIRSGSGIGDAWVVRVDPTPPRGLAGWVSPMSCATVGGSGLATDGAS